MLHELVVGYHPFRQEGASEEQVMATIRAARLSIPDYVDRPLAAVIARSLAPEARHRYRSAGEFAGPLFAHALDRSLLPAPAALKEWLQGVLGLLA
jgi:serine/threonine-protein kinase